ncbi:MAG: endonuclease/exonuclease/phosphatase family protein [Methanotrichaceae archaeon]|nr:endonuclease/exonuclease/phosphatase family protein [Methanotrichaceae archaeon]
MGWIELRKEAIDDQAIKNTARVIAEVNSDILVLVEIENRPTLQHFYDQVLVPMLQEKGYESYGYNMVIDGNDNRGIDVGLLSRMSIVRMRSHIDDSSNGKTIFSRDCPEYYIELGNGSELVVLPNHFASKGSDVTGKRRKVQSNQVKKIYQGLKASRELVVVVGDLNDHPAGGSLDALVKEYRSQGCYVVGCV